MEASKDWVQFVLDQPMAAEPGSAFVYSSGVTELLAAGPEEATGRHADEYAAEHLFAPLGIERFYWKQTPTGQPDTEGGLYLTPRDLAKIGYLYMKDGVWEGRRLLPEGWVGGLHAAPSDPGRRRRLAEVRLPVVGAAGEGARPTPASATAASYLIVVPSRELIAVFTGWNIYDKPALSADHALDRVLEAIRAR